MTATLRLLALLALAAIAVAQDEAPADADGDEVAATTDALESTADEADDEAAVSGTPPGDADDEAVAEVPLDDADLDEQTYEENEDVFIPTEEIPADEPIPFPSDI